MFAAISVVVPLLQLAVEPGDLFLQHHGLPRVASGLELLFKLLLLLTQTLDLRIDLICVINVIKIARAPNPLIEKRAANPL